MGRQLSPKAVNILRATLEQVERDPDLGEDNPGVSEFKRIVLNRVAEMEGPGIQPAATPSQTSAIGTALNLAAALVAGPAKVNEESAFDGAFDQVLESANNPELANAEATALRSQEGVEIGSGNRNLRDGEQIL